MGSRRRARGGIAAAAIATVLAVLATPAAANTVLLGPPDLTTGPSAPYDCTGSCQWAGAFNVSLGSSPGSLVAPADGTVTGWRVKGAAAGVGAVRLHVVRSLGGDKYIGIADTPPAGALDGIGSNSGGAAPLQAGDVLSVTVDKRGGSGAAAVMYRATPDALFDSMSILAAGGTASGSGSPTPNQLLLYNATVELSRPEVAAVSPLAGPAGGGTPVTISGAHLAVATGVSFGGVPALSFSGDNNAITAIAPPQQAGAVDVTVTTAGGESAAIPGARFAYETGDDGKAPKLKAFGVAPRKFEAANIGGPILPLVKVGATVKFKLSEQAKVVFSVLRGTAGRKVGGRCGKASGSNRGKPRCRRFAKLKGSFSVAGEAGANSFLFSGRLRGTELAPGDYRLKAVAKDPFGDRSAPKQAPFAIADRVDGLAHAASE